MADRPPVDAYDRRREYRPRSPARKRSPSDDSYYRRRRRSPSPSSDRDRSRHRHRRRRRDAEDDYDRPRSRRRRERDEDDRLPRDTTERPGLSRDRRGASPGPSRDRRGPPRGPSRDRRELSRDRRGPSRDRRGPSKSSRDERYRDAVPERNVGPDIQAALAKARALAFAEEKPKGPQQPRYLPPAAPVRGRGRGNLLPAWMTNMTPQEKAEYAQKNPTAQRLVDS